MDFANIAYDLLETDRFSSQTTSPIEYNTLIYEDFCDWILASATVPPFMEVVEKDGYQ